MLFRSELEAEEEIRLRNSLESLHYELDDSNTLELVVGDSNLDKVRQIQHITWRSVNMANTIL